jgi:hypothetical protein
MFVVVKAKMAAQPSPRRSGSDSMDYDDELAELMSNPRRERERDREEEEERDRERECGESDEDTEDASEDGGESLPRSEDTDGPQKGLTNIKEQ